MMFMALFYPHYKIYKMVTFPMVFPWFSHGFSMVSPRSPPESSAAVAIPRRPRLDHWRIGKTMGDFTSKIVKHSKNAQERKTHFEPEHIGK